MALEGLQENLKEKWAEILAQVQESSAFNTVREQFEAQSPAIQRAIIAGSSLLAVLFVLSLPMSYISSSNDNLAIFDENRGLIQGLLRASRTAKEAPPLPPPLDSGSLRGMIDRMLKDKKLAPEQIGEMAAIPGTPSKLAPAVVVQNGIAAQIKQLNLTQIIDIANSVNNLGAGTKLIGLDVVPSMAASHYYDINIRVVNFGLTPVNFDTGDSKGGPKGKGGRPPPGRPNAKAGGGGGDDGGAEAPPKAGGEQ